MSSSSVTKFLLTPSAKASIERLKYEIFGTLPQLNTKTGFQAIKRMHRGAYVARYYPEPIEKFARMATPGYQSELELRRSEKLETLRRRGKGPPKKGAGKKKRR